LSPFVSALALCLMWRLNSSRALVVCRLSKFCVARSGGFSGLSGGYKKHLLSRHEHARLRGAEDRMIDPSINNQSCRASTLAESTSQEMRCSWCAQSIEIIFADSPLMLLPCPPPITI
jgi:hypothetical protein